MYSLMIDLPLLIIWHGTLFFLIDSVETLSYSKEKHISQIVSENGKSRRLHQNVNEYLWMLTD